MLEGKAKLIFLGVLWLILLAITVALAAMGYGIKELIWPIIVLLSPVLLIVMKGSL